MPDVSDIAVYQKLTAIADELDQMAAQARPWSETRP